MPGQRRKMQPFMNRLSMDEQKTILGLPRLGWSEPRIARETGNHRATIRWIALEVALEPESVPAVVHTTGGWRKKAHAAILSRVPSVCGHMLDQRRRRHARCFDGDVPGRLVGLSL